MHLVSQMAEPAADRSAGLHGKHAAALVAPAAAEYVLAAQLVQVVAPAALYLPAAHCAGCVLLTVPTGPPPAHADPAGHATGVLSEAPVAPVGM